MVETRRREAGTGGPSLELVAKATLVVIGLWALANALWLGRDVLFIAFFALLIASFLSIFVEPLHRRGVARAVSAPLLLLAFLLVLTLTFLVTWPTLVREFSLIQRQLPPAIDFVQRWLDAQMSELMGSLGQTGAAAQRDVRQRMSSELGNLIGGALPLLNTAMGAVAGLVIVLAAGMFIAISPRTYMRGLIMLIPRGHRERAGEVLPHAGQAMMQWMKGAALGMVIVGVVTGVGLWLIGVPAALALGVIAGLLEFVPYVGPTLSFVPAIVMALAVSPQKALWAVGLYAVVQGVESNPSA